VSIVTLITPFLNSDCINSSQAKEKGSKEKTSNKKSPIMVSADDLIAQLRETKGITIAQQFFEADVSTEVGLAAVTLHCVAEVIDSIKQNSKLAQSEAYWLVDLWGRAQALRALVLEFAQLIDSGNPSSVGASAFRSRAAVMILGCEELFEIIGARLPEENNPSRSALIARIQAERAKAKASVEGHISDF